MFGCVTAAHAELPIHLEAGVGGAAYSRGPDGYWVQERFPHKLQLTAPAYEVGFTGDLYRASRWGISWHADWAWLGQIHTQSLATPSDDNYNPTSATGCNGECLPLANFRGSGHAQALLLTLEPHYDVGKWRFGIEAGPTLHRATWVEDVSNWHGTAPWPITLRVSSTDGWRPGAVIGASVSYGNVSLVYQHFFIKPSNNNLTPSIWHSVDLLLLRYRF
ncbi:hypothetical protein [Ralstonia sp. Ralssp135]|uniref:hypothetical protein n=1 Tax=Ralstonia sp. Ralssp135 TaxID=3243016 RepID=UPI0039AFD86F